MLQSGHSGDGYDLVSTPVAARNAAFCMTCSLLMLIKDAIGDHTEEAYSRAGLITAL